MLVGCQSASDGIRPSGRWVLRETISAAGEPWYNLAPRSGDHASSDSDRQSRLSDQTRADD
jgi:hypothetical protein